MDRKELLEINQGAWNNYVAKGNRWTLPVDDRAIAEARQGNLKIVLTPQALVPNDWFPELRGCRTLLLAGAGGQQAPLMAAAGAEVTVVDLSQKQLEQDQIVARREGLQIRSIQTSMDDLSMLEDESFELVVHPCSNCYVPKLEPVWREVARVTKKNGCLLTGFCNPLIFLFDEERAAQGVLEVAHALPYSDEHSLPADRYQGLLDDGEALIFGHTLSDQIGGQLRAGFALIDLYEDSYEVDPSADPVNSGVDPVPMLLEKYTAAFIATRSIKAGRLA